MRWVRNSRLPQLVDLTPLEALRQQLNQIVDADARAEFISDNSGAWSPLRPAMWGLNGCKCWYSEAYLQVQQGHVEHYRPKGKVAGETHPGYWWHAFDWTNYRLAHPTVNVRVTDYLTGKLAGKGTYFPLREGSHRAFSETEEAGEDPVLLDPTKAADCRLLCFELTSGKPIPRIAEAQDAWRHQRAADSIRFYHLDEGSWNVQRKDLVDEVQNLCDRIEQLHENLPTSQTDYDAAVDELTEYLTHTAQFSSVAIQVVQERGLLDHVHPPGALGNAA